MITQEELTALLNKQFPNAIVEIEDMAGDSNHYSITISSAEFKNLNLLSQHRLVYERLGEFSTIIHAIKIKTIVL